MMICVFPWFSVSYFGITWPQQDPVLETVVFHGPASRGDVKLLKLLLSAVDDVNVQVKLVVVVIMVLIKWSWLRSYKILKLLLSAVNDVNAHVKSADCSNCVSFFCYSQAQLMLYLFMSNCISVCQSRLMLYLSNIKWQDGEGSSALHVVTEQLQEAAEEEAQNLVRMSTQLKIMRIIIMLVMGVVVIVVLINWSWLRPWLRWWLANK